MRNIISLNDNWYFTKESIGTPAALTADILASWDKVSLPHTWNGVDGQDGKGDYFKGACWYAKYLPAPKVVEGTRIFVEVLAAAMSGRVYVNGKEVGYHEGGYSSFALDITDMVTESVNLLVICVDNTDRTHIYPQMADFTFYGGLYRGVNLITVPATHFDLEYYGAPGLSITATPQCEGAVIKLQSFIKNGDENYTVKYEITDEYGDTVAEIWRPSTSPDVELTLPEAHLWQGVEDPYLYTCTATLVRRNETVDEVSSRFGIRSFHVDPEKGFFLNGKPMMLRGVSRHQDRLYQGNALTRSEHYEDAHLIYELGANTVRLAHYQHSQDFYDACDEYGFIVWAEIPYISCQSDDPLAHENCRMQMKDLIYQNYNHPSICFWGLSNEITISGEKPGLVENHKDLNELVKSIDPTRLTTIAHVSMLPIDSALHGITDVESYNHYFGWYGGTYDNNEKWLDHFHATYPGICIGLSEYGAEGIITYQPDEPKCRDYSEAYQAEYHEHMVKILMERPYIWSTHVWNMFDFGCAARDEGGVAGRNNKGLVTIDRKIKKDAYFIYKAYWSEDPFVYITGRRYAQRVGDTTTIKVYSNQPTVSLYTDGKLLQTLDSDKIFVFENVPLKDGFTSITAKAPVNADDEAPEYIPTDTVVFEKVAEKPAIYTLAEEEDDDSRGAANWFDQAAAEAANAPSEMQFPEGYFSIRDKIKDIIKNEEAYEVLANALHSMSGMKMKKGMLLMVGDKTLEGLASMAAGMGGDKAKNIPANAMHIINAQLNKIKK